MPQPQPWGTEIAVATEAGQQWRPDVATNRDGVSLVVWESGGLIQARAVDPFGVAAAPSFTIPSTFFSITTQGALPKVAALPNGNFAVTWAANHISPSDHNNYTYQLSAIVSSTGEVIGNSVVQVYADTNEVVDTAVLARDDGSYVVASYAYFWQEPGHYRAAVSAVHFGANGQRLSTLSFQTNDYDMPAVGRGALDMAGGSDGGIAISYTVPDEAGIPLSINTVRTNSGTIYFGPNENLTFTQDVAIGLLDTGQYVQVAGIDFFGRSIYSTVLDSEGDDIPTSTGPLNQGSIGTPVLSVDVATIPGSAGGYVGVWDSRGANYDVIARQVAPGDVSNDFVVNASTAGEQYQAQVTRMPDGRLFFVYASTTSGAAYLDGNENVLARIWDGRPQTIQGPEGGATLVGRPTGMNFADDIILAGGGGDRLYGLSGNDSLDGGGGGDLLVGDAGADTMNGASGADTLRGGAGADRLTGGGEADRFDFDSVAEIGNAQNARDVITDFLPGVDKIDLDGVDALSTLAGLQHFTWLGTAAHTGAGATLRYQQSAGKTLVYGETNANGGADFTLQLNGLFNLTAADFTNLSIGTIQGTGGADTLAGAPGGKGMLGLDGNDTITGGAGADTIFGGAGADSITGGLGADQFKLSSAAHTGATAATRDVITDFQKGVDRIDLSGIDASSLVAGNQAFVFLGTAGHTGAGATLRFQQAGGNTIVYGDINGDKAADFAIQLTGLHALAAADFVL